MDLKAELAACLETMKENVRLREQQLAEKQSFEDFWKRVDKNGPMPPNLPPEAGPCWIWIGTLNDSGYGSFRVHFLETTAAVLGTKRATHVAWFLEYGVWPTHNLCHACDNPPCVNPGHLFEGTNEDNNYDRRVKNHGGILIDWPQGPQGKFGTK